MRSITTQRRFRSATTILLSLVFHGTAIAGDRERGQSNVGAVLLGDYLSAVASGPSDESQEALTHLSFVGDYVTAQSARALQTPIARVAKQRPLPTDSVDVPVEQIMERAAGKKVVLFNEIHILPKTRIVTLRLLPKLRQDGFNYLALEALDPTPDDLTQRGFPLESSGTYTKEPVFGELVRSAIELGFKVVPYEHSSAQGFSPEKREAAQAENLLKIIRSDPDARIVIHAGHDHIYKTGRIGDSPTMAQKLMKAIPAERMLMIDQTQMIAANASTSTAYESALAKWSGSGPFVVRSADGQFYSAEPDRYDISVFFAPDTLAKGRPAWLDLNGIRSSRVVSSSVCDGAFPCLVEVHYNAEMDNAVAADRYVFTAPSQETFMYTRRRGVVFSVTDKNGTRSIAEPASLSPYKLPF